MGARRQWGGALAAGLAGLALAVGPARAAEAPVRLTGVAVEPAEGAVHVDIVLTGPAEHRTDVIPRPYRVAVDFEGTAYAWRREPLVVAVDPIREIRGSQYRKGVARIVIEFRRPVAWRLERLPTGLRVRVVTGASAPPPAAVKAGPPPAAAKAAPPAATAPPAPASPPAAPAAAPAPAPAAGALPAAARRAGPRLQGVVVFGDTSTAYVEVDGRVAAYRVGDALAGGRVATIGEDHVVVERPGGRLELRLPPR